MCDDFAIMNGGELVEILPRQALLDGSAQHPYSRSLIGASLEYDQAV
jgi:ABC-type dipeptide/oligopeptide/nickel transport system ATPase subunit